MPEQFFVTGTDTDVGKTVLSALLCAALNAVYWKPIQTGAIEGCDRDRVLEWAEIPGSDAPPEAYRLNEPLSPHLAAQRAGITIELPAIRLPAVARDRAVVVEGAGGVLVPINERLMMVDLICSLGIPALLVCRTSLGTINHTVLSLRALREAKVPVTGVVMIGPENPENRSAIEHYGATQVVGHVPPLTRISRSALLGVFRNEFDQRLFRV